MDPQSQDWPQLGRKPNRGGRAPAVQEHSRPQPRELTPLSPYQFHSLQLFDPEEASLHWKYLIPPASPELPALQDPAILRVDALSTSYPLQTSNIESDMENMLSQLSLKSPKDTDDVAKKQKPASRQTSLRSIPPHLRGDPLTRLVQETFRDLAIQKDEIDEKERFRLRLELLCKSAVSLAEGTSGDHVKLLKFGSIGNGFATKASDMDLILVSPQSDIPLGSAESPIPTTLEKAFLEEGIGARLLTNTRVPIIKLCENPSPDLLAKLKEANEIKIAPKEEPAKTETQLERVRHETLWSYFKRAKYRHFSNQGRDYSIEQSTPLAPEEFISLNDFCYEFLNGLNDEALTSQLHTYLQSSAYWPLRDPMVPSLFTLYFVVEAVRLSHAWADRIIPEAELTKEEQGRALIRKVVEILNRPNVETLWVCSNLRNPVERLLAFPSLQLHLLEQGPNEWQSTYLTKANRIYEDLSQVDLERKQRLMFLVTYRYVAGLYDERIRVEVAKFCERHNVNDLKTASAQVIGEQELKETHGNDKDRPLIDLYTHAMRTFGRESTRADVVSLGNRVRSLKGQAKPRKTLQLEFPKTGIGIQCDITFTSHLALQNTLLLRCYAQCDPRVTPLALFVKSWAKKRNVNSPYHGTLSSYGFVLMVLHYLMNVAVPPVIPNLQAMESYPMTGESDPALQDSVAAYNVEFWRDEAAIREAARLKRLTNNAQSLGELARGFFQYYTPQGRHSRFGFDWMQNVISIRTPGGIRQKRQKGWTGLKVTTIDSGEEKREVKNRYLLAVEDPFEVHHNVARTVTQTGLSSLQSEFVRAWQIINTGNVEDLMYGYDEQ